MVFSLFKKRPETMVSRPAVIPRPAARSEDAQAPKEEQARDESASNVSQEEFSDLGFSQSSLNFQVNDNVDPINGPAEEAAILFADNQDQSAQIVLENALKQPQSQQSGPTERLWLMLFDLYRLSGQQSAFETISIDYARAFEKSPPSWRAESELPDPAKASTTKDRDGSVRFKGDLLGGNVSSFDAVRQALEKNHAVRLDLSKVKQVDAEGCACLLKLLLHAGKDKRGIELLGRDALASLVKNSIEEGKKETPVTGKECWLLLLELLQQQGQQEVFEDLAIDYAVTFEESPPSWESKLVAESEPVVPELEDESAAPDDGVYVLSGEIKSSHFDNLSAFAEGQDSLLIDCAKLTRIDFVSAGALLNTLTTVRSKGKQIVLRYPNRLVAELFRVVGLSAVAVAVFAKQ
jgi:ABC-type transporter Mla MlaB component